MNAPTPGRPPAEPAAGAAAPGTAPEPPEAREATAGRTREGQASAGRAARDASGDTQEAAERTAAELPRGAGRFLRWDTAAGILLVLVALAGAGTTEGFAGVANLSAALGDTAEIALIALPMTLLVVAGQVDLSVASMLGLSSAIAGALWDAGWAFELIVPVCLAAGVAGGLVNGLLVTRLRLPPLAVTIGTLTLYRGLASVVLGNRAVSDFPDSYARWASHTEPVPGTFVPYPIALFAALAVLAAFVLHCTAAGRAMFAIGAQEDAARFAGIRVRRVKLALFAVTGLTAAFAGIVYTLRYGSARADNGLGMELVVIASVLLGGVDFNGGRGTLGGAVAGVLLIGVLDNLLTLNDVSNEIQVVVTGVLLVASVLAPRVVSVVSDRGKRRTATG